MITKLLRLRIPIALVSDCVGTDPDAELRLTMLIQSLFGATPTMRNVKRADVLAFLMADSFTRAVRPGLMIGNIAPRLRAHKHENGIPFCWTKLTNGHTVVSTAQPEAFAGFKLFGVLPEDGVHIVDTKAALQAMIDAGLIDEELLEHIALSQFRSLDFEPLLAAAILLGIKIPSKEHMLPSKVPDFGRAVAYVDHFDNCKLWIPESKVKDLSEGTSIPVKIKGKHHELPFYRQLRNVPDKKMAVTIGSSGYHGNHLLELVINGGKAAKTLRLKVGDEVLLEG